LTDKTLLKGTAAGITTVFLWSSAASFITAAHGVQPFLYYGTEMLIGFLIFALRWTWAKRDPRPALRRVPPWYVLAGIFGIGFQGVAWVAAIQHAPPLEALLFIYQWPLLVVVFTALALKKPLQRHHFFALALGACGIVTVLVGRGMDLGQFSLTVGHVYGLVAALAWSLFSALCARNPQVGPDGLALALLAGGIVNLLIWIFGFGMPMPPLHGFLVCLTASVVIMPGYMFWDYGVKTGDSRLIGFASFLIPVLSSIMLILTGQARFNFYILLALLIVMTGLGVARFGGRRTEAGG
jgi:drug/metabolite transporter (DMT)-like permease